MTVANDLKRPEFFPALTGLRAVAAALVFWHHYNPFPINGSVQFLNSLVQEFQIGVSLFFTLSGFLIAHSFIQAQSFHWKPYLIKRFARIYPMYFILTTITFLLATESDRGVYWLNISFVRGFFDYYIFTLVSQGWSLTVEECFYLLAPMLIVSIQKSVWRFIGLACLLLVIGYVLVLVLRGVSEYGLFNNNKFMLTYTFFGRSFEFLCGVALAVWGKKLPLSRKYTGLSISGIGLIVLLMAWHGRDWNNRLDTIGIALNNFLLPFATVSLFFGLTTEKTWLSALLSSRVLQVLGKASYAFYLIHLGFISEWISGWPINSLLLFVVLQVVAVMLWYCVEEPLRKVILRWADKW